MKTKIIAIFNVTEGIKNRRVAPTPYKNVYQGVGDRGRFLYLYIPAQGAAIFLGEGLPNERYTVEWYIRQAEQQAEQALESVRTGRIYANWVAPMFFALGRLDDLKAAAQERAREIDDLKAAAQERAREIDAIKAEQRKRDGELAKQEAIRLGDAFLAGESLTPFEFMRVILHLGINPHPRTVGLIKRLTSISRNSIGYTFKRKPRLYGVSALINHVLSLLESTDNQTKGNQPNA